MKKTVLKKLLAMAILTVTTVSLIGCDKSDKNNESTPTVEELFSNTYNNKDLESGDMDICISMDMNAFIEELDTNIDAIVETDLNVKFENDKYYISGNAKADMYGVTTNQEMDSYIVKHDEDYTIYAHEPENENWYYVISNENVDVTTYMNLIDIDESLYKNFTVSSSDNYYIASGEVTLKDITKALEMTTEEFFDDLITDGNGKYDDTKVDITVLFNKKTEEVEEFKVTINACELGPNKLNNMVVTLTINDVNNTKVELPVAIVELEEQ